jgi:multidrug resistance efflux pump
VNSIGELKAARSTIITAPYDGKIVKLVPEGAPVAQGDPVIWLDTDEFTEQLKDHDAQLQLALKDLETAREEYRLQELQNEYNLRAEEARVELAEQRLVDARQRATTERELVERNISARSKLEEAELSLAQATVELRSAQINLQKTKENLSSNLRVRQTGIDKAQLEVDRIQRQIKDVQDKIDQAILRSPTDGEVAYFRIWRSGSSTKVAEGDTVWPRLNLLEIPDRSQMLAVVPVNELDVAEVMEGQAAIVTLDAIPNRTFPGTVERKSIVPIDTQQLGGRFGTTTGGGGPKEFEVRVRLTDREPFFFQGMTAAVQIVTSGMEQATQIPLEALTLENEQVGAFRLSGTVSEFVPLTVLMTNDRHAAVEGGLRAGERVALRHPNLPADEARARGFATLQRVEADLREKRTAENERLRELQAKAAEEAGQEAPGGRRRGQRPDGAMPGGVPGGAGPGGAGGWSRGSQGGGARP